MWIKRLRASVLRAGVLVVLLMGSLLSVVVSAPTPASAQTTDTTTTDTDTTTDPTPVARQYAGADRYETSANLAYSFAARSSSSNSVILAGGGLIDAAAAAGLARALNAPVLLTPTDTLSPQARQFIIDRSIRTVYVVGGEAAVSAAVAAELAAIPNPPTVERLAGPDRYATSAALSRAITQPAGTQPAGTQPAGTQPAGTQPASTQPADYCGTGIPTAVLANVDKTFADVIALGPLAYSQRVPVLLTSVDSVSQAVTDYLAEAGIKQVVVVGGTAAVSAAVVAQLEAAGTQVQRVSGPTRYATALSIRAEMGACEGLTLSPSTYALINGEASADGIAAGPLLGLGLASDGVTPVLLVERDQLPPESQQHLDAVNAAQQSNPAHPPVVLTVIGGVAVVSPEVAQAAAETADATQAVATATTTTTTPPDDDDDGDDRGGGGGGGGGGNSGNSGGGNSGGTPPTTPTTTIPAVGLTGLPTETQRELDFGATASGFTLTADPVGSTVTAVSDNSIVTVAIAVADAATGTHTLTITPPATDGGTYTDTVTITATDPDGNHLVLTETITFSLFNPAATFSALTPDPNAINFMFGADVFTSDITVTPSTATLKVASSDRSPNTGTFNLSIAPKTGGAAGEWTVSIQILATDPGTEELFYGETGIITATEANRRDATTTFLLTASADTITLTGLPDTAATPFTFGGPDIANPVQTQTFDFTVTPANATVTFTATADVYADDNLLASVAATGGGAAADSNSDRYTLTVTAPAEDIDPSLGYTDTITVVATDTTAALSSATHVMTITLTPEPISLSEFFEEDTAPFEFGDLVREIVFDVFPDAVSRDLNVTVSDATLFEDVEITEDPIIPASFILSLRPPATDPGSGPYTETLTITVAYTGDDGPRDALTHPLTFTINQPSSG